MKKIFKIFIFIVIAFAAVGLTACDKKENGVFDPFNKNKNNWKNNDKPSGGNSGDGPTISGTIRIYLPSCATAEGNVNLKKVPVGTTVKVNINVPEGKVVDKVFVNGTPLSSMAVDETTKEIMLVATTVDLHVEITFKDPTPVDPNDDDPNGGDIEGDEGGEGELLEGTVRVILPSCARPVDSTIDLNNVPYRTEIKLIIDVPEGKEVESITANDKDITNAYYNGEITIRPLTEDLYIAVVFRDIEN